MEKKVTIIIAAHKQYQMPTDEMYLPLQVGASGKQSIGYQRDDDGENISYLNPGFCELTGLYWAWKNLSSEYLGLVQYRRYFSFHPHQKDKWSAVLKQSEIEKYFGKIKIFVPQKRIYYIETLYSHYAHTHYASQLDETKKIIAQIYPDYLESLDKVQKRLWGYMFNMMIMERNLYCEYCSWLFDILFELKARIGNQAEKELDSYQQRLYGRISEIIFNVWLDRKVSQGEIQTKEIKEIPVIHMEKINWVQKGSAFLNAKFKGEKYTRPF